MDMDCDTRDVEDTTHQFGSGLEVLRSAKLLLQELLADLVNTTTKPVADTEEIAATLEQVEKHIRVLSKLALGIARVPELETIDHQLTNEYVRNELASRVRATLSTIDCIEQQMIGHGVARRVTPNGVLHIQNALRSVQSILQKYVANRYARITQLNRFNIANGANTRPRMENNRMNQENLRAAAKDNLIYGKRLQLSNRLKVSTAVLSSRRMEGDNTMLAMARDGVIYTTCHNDRATRGTIYKLDLDNKTPEPVCRIFEDRAMTARIHSTIQEGGMWVSQDQTTLLVVVLLSSTRETAPQEYYLIRIALARQEVVTRERIPQTQYQYIPFWAYSANDDMLIWAEANQRPSVGPSYSKRPASYAFFYKRGAQPHETMSDPLSHPLPDKHGIASAFDNRRHHDRLVSISCNRETMSLGTKSPPRIVFVYDIEFEGGSGIGSPNEFGETGHSLLFLGFSLPDMTSTTPKWRLEHKHVAFYNVPATALMSVRSSVLTMDDILVVCGTLAEPGRAARKNVENNYFLTVPMKTLIPTDMYDFESKFVQRIQLYKTDLTKGPCYSHLATAQYGIVVAIEYVPGKGAIPVELVGTDYPDDYEARSLISRAASVPFDVADYTGQSGLAIYNDLTAAEAAAMPTGLEDEVRAESAGDRKRQRALEALIASPHRVELPAFPVLDCSGPAALTFDHRPAQHIAASRLSSNSKAYAPTTVSIAWMRPLAPSPTTQKTYKQYSAKAGVLGGGGAAAPPPLLGEYLTQEAQMGPRNAADDFQASTMEFNNSFRVAQQGVQPPPRPCAPSDQELKNMARVAYAQKGEKSLWSGMVNTVMGLFMPQAQLIEPFRVRNDVIPRLSKIAPAFPVWVKYEQFGTSLATHYMAVMPDVGFDEDPQLFYFVRKLRPYGLVANEPYSMGIWCVPAAYCMRLNMAVATVDQDNGLVKVYDNCGRSFVIKWYDFRMTPGPDYEVARQALLLQYPDLLIEEMSTVPTLATVPQTTPTSYRRMVSKLPKQVLRGTPAAPLEVGPGTQDEEGAGQEQEV